MVKYIPNYYEILKINRDADTEHITEAYKKLSKKYNPEKNNSKNAKLLYKLINDAYVVLTDDRKRKKYDKILEKEEYEKLDLSDNENMDTEYVENSVKDGYDKISKLFKVVSNGKKGKSLLSGTNLLMGGAMAGYGIKKGRDYMTKRGQNK